MNCPHNSAARESISKGESGPRSEKVWEPLRQTIGEVHSGPLWIEVKQIYQLIRDNRRIALNNLRLKWVSMEWSRSLHRSFSTFLVPWTPSQKWSHTLLLYRLTTILIEAKSFLSFLLQRWSKKWQKKSLKLAPIQHQKTNKRIESTQLADPLGAACGLPVEKPVYKMA
jgi:hypothetical protein